MSINYTAEGGEQYDAGLGTTPGMWECLSEALAEAHIALPESLNEAIYALCEGRAKVVLKD